MRSHDLNRLLDEPGSKRVACTANIFWGVPPKRGAAGGLREAIFTRLKTEWRATIEALLSITSQSELLAGNPLLSRSMRNRYPYLDPLNHLQIELMRRHRSGPPWSEDERVRSGIHLTINGVSAGLRNSG